jgi:hypothetical protein
MLCKTNHQEILAPTRHSNSTSVVSIDNLNKTEEGICHELSITLEGKQLNLDNQEG